MESLGKILQMMPRENDPELDSSHYQVNMQESVESVQSLLGQCGLDPLAPEPHSTFDFFDPSLQTSAEAQREATELLQAVKAWSEEEEGTEAWLLIAGPTGTGKTQLLKTAVWSQKLRNVWSRYITAYTFDRQVKTFQTSTSDRSSGVFKDPDTWVEELASIPGGLAIVDVGGVGYRRCRGWLRR